MSQTTTLNGGSPTTPGQGSDGAPGKMPLRSDDQWSADVVKDAQKRFERTASWESSFRGHFIDDLKFAEADAYNGYQWPNEIRRNRDVDQRPCLTINKVRQHNLQIINDAKQNKAAISIRPTGNQATYEAADALSGLIRHIEYQSNAPAAYDMASSFQVRGGFGVVRVATDFVGEDFDMEIFIRPIPDPLTVMFDPDSRQPDKSDARFAFVFDDIDRGDFGRIYPKYADYVPPLGFGGSTSGDWLGKDKVRICEYFFVEAKEDTKVRYLDEDGKLQTKMLSAIAEEKSKEVLDDPRTRARTVVWTEVHWVLIVGDKIAEHKIVPGIYIPLVPMIGEETIIQGIMDRKGHTRSLIDPQRMYNYWASAAVEYGALQTKTPWVAPVKAIEGLETYWNNANKQNISVLPYNHVDDGEGGDPTALIPPPSRTPPPEQSNLYIQGIQQTREEMMMVSGQYQAQMGQPSNERSGKAIQERQRQGDNATYHFIDGQASCIRQVGRVILGWIPHVYNSKRIVNILAEDGQSYEVTIDPAAEKAFEEKAAQAGFAAQKILNPNIGRYSVEADVGPGYATKRQEAANGMQQILTNAPELTSIFGDILLRNMDFPGADEAARRMERMVPPQATGKGPSPQEAQLTQQLQQLQQVLSQTMAKMASMALKLQGKEQMRDIDVYKAETERFGTVLKNAPQSPELTDEVVRQTVQQMMTDQLGPVIQSSLASMMGQFGQSGTSPTPPEGLAGGGQSPQGSPPGGPTQ